MFKLKLIVKKPMPAVDIPAVEPVLFFYDLVGAEGR